MVMNFLTCFFWISWHDSFFDVVDLFVDFHGLFSFVFFSEFSWHLFFFNLAPPKLLTFQSALAASHTAPPDFGLRSDGYFGEKMYLGLGEKLDVVNYEEWDNLENL